jgi:hypothetical protein
MITVQASDPIGSVSSFTQFPNCPPGGPGTGTCYQLAISCPGVSDFSAYLKVYTPAGAPIGTVLFGVGTGGSGLYEDPTIYTDGSTVVGNVLSAGFNTVEVSFGAPFDNGTTPRGWLTGPGGVRRLACRYATVADWVYKNPNVINPNSTASNSTPMCATGNSGGSAAIGYAVYEYGLDSEFSMVELSSGPVMSRIDEGCAPCSTTANVCPGSSNKTQLCYEVGDAGIIDQAYQAPTASTPTVCTDALHGTSGTDVSARLLSDSILWMGNSPVNLHTTIKQVFADLDTSNAVAEGLLFEGLVTPNPPFACLANVQHDIPSFSTGAQTLSDDIIQNCH